ncbi:MAG: DNA mismatch repair protein, partial [Bacteroidetes bacterium]|nr:DNA mismatch repair protein [Bacteroidota bacterium]
MSFTADKQTLEDLGLAGKFRPNSVYGLFNKVKTAGGERLLDELFRRPMTDPHAINERSATFRYFQDKKLVFPFQRASFSLVETYLGSDTPGNAIAATTGVLRKKMMGSFLRDEQYGTLQAGLQKTIEALNALRVLLQPLDIDLVQKAKAILADSRLSWLGEAQGLPQLPVMKVAVWDRLLRHTLRTQMETVLDTIYQLDVLIAVSDTAREKGFSYACAVPAAENIIRATAIRHPALDKGVANPIELTGKNNVLFLTGANMAGKSTFMKSFGIAVYLAHIGFPV